MQFRRESAKVPIPLLFPPISYGYLSCSFLFVLKFSSHLIHSNPLNIFFLFVKFKNSRTAVKI
jgi:hypothetical protein